MSRDCYSRCGPEGVNTGNMAPVQEPPHRETGPQEPAPRPTIKSLGGVEGVYNLIKNGTDAEKEAFIDLAQGF